MSRYTGQILVGKETVKLDALYFTYWSLRDPLTESQTLPVVRALAKNGYRMGLITYEQSPFAIDDQDERAQISASLHTNGIYWYPLTYHRRPHFVSTLWDALRGTASALWLRHRTGVRMFHSRSTVPAAPASIAAALSGALFFYDSDGPLSEEYVDAGVWSRRSMAYRITRWCECRFLRAANAVAVLTERRRRALQPLYDGPIAVVPCAVDTAHFVFDPKARVKVRNELGLEGTVLVYAGKWSGWYGVEDMMDFVAVAREQITRLSLLILTREPPGRFHAAARQRGIEDILITQASSRETMASYLSSADVGLSFRYPFPSTAGCSPVKNGEYLACGLPVVTPAGIGDYSDLISRSRTGIVLEGLNKPAYRKAASGLRELLGDPHLRRRCRETGRSQVGLSEVVVPRYLEVYRDLLGLPPRAAS